MRGFLAAAALLVVSGFVYWVGPALNWAEWLVVGLFFCVVASFWLVSGAKPGYEDSHGFHDGRPDEELAEIFEWPVSDDVSHVRHKGLGR